MMNKMNSTGFMVMALIFLTPLPVMAASAVEINAKVTATLADFYKTVGSGKALAAKAGWFQT